MIKTYEQIIDFTTVASSFTKEKTKFAYACQKVINRVALASKKATKKYQERLADIDIEFASVDEKDNLVLDGNKYCYTKENARKRLDAIRIEDAKLYETKIEFEPHYCNELPELNDYQISSLVGFVIDEKENTNDEKVIDDTNSAVK